MTNKKYIIKVKLISIILGIILILMTALYLYLTEFRDREWQYKSIKENEFKKYYTNEEIILELYQLMKDFHEIMVKNEIQYWIESGTLLGAVRNGGIIKFDDDLDVHILHEDEIRFQNLIPEFEKLGYIVPNEYYYSICKLNKPVCLDVFIGRYTDEGKVIYANRFAREKYPNSFFYVNEIFPLKKYKFGAIEVFGPRDPKPYLDRNYSEWQTYGVIHQKHSGLYQLGINKIKFLLTPELLKPAKPTGPLINRVY